MPRGPLRTFSARPRSPVTSRHGMVATSQPLAVQTGLDILKNGGTAVDAAIAANVMLGLVEPMSCGPGGDLFAIVWDEDHQRLHGLNASGRSPASMTWQDVLDRGYAKVPFQGPLSWSVPGCVDGWHALHERFGRLRMEALLQPTITAARDGFEVTPVIARQWATAAERLADDPGARDIFLVDGRAPNAGERFVNPQLAQTLEALCASGRDAFYRGDLADALSDFSAAIGGFLTKEDLAAHRSSWVEPVCVPFRGHQVWQLPPNTQGLALLQMLTILDPFDLESMDPQGVELLHLLIEAKKLAYEDRARFYADPDFFDVPIEALLSDERAACLRRRFDPDRAAAELIPDDPRTAHADTVYLTAVDADGNAVSLIQSIYHEFGSGVVPPDLGFAMQNRACLFHVDPAHANAYRPGKRPFHTIMPGFVTRDGHPVFSFGVMGGDMQPQGQLQVLLHRLVFRADVQTAGEALRFRHAGSSTPVDHVMTDGGTVLLEPGFPENVREGLRAKGHRVETRNEGFGGYQGIWIDRDAGVLHGGSEPRKDGCALGF